MPELTVRVSRRTVRHAALADSRPRAKSWIMRRHWVVLGAPLAALLLAAWSRAGQEPAQNPDLMRVQREVWEVFFAGDTARLRALTPGLIAIDGGSTTFSDQESMVRSSARFHAGGGRLVELTFPVLRVQRFGDVAIVYSKYRLVTVMGGDTSRQGGRATEVFVRQNGAWVNPGWHLDSGQ
jgi:hypothetical protein